MKTVIYNPKKGGIRLPRYLNLTTLKERIELVSGANHLDDSEVKILQAHDAYHRHSQTGVLTIVAPEVSTNAEDGAPSDLKAYSVNDAEEIIGKESDTEILAIWRKRDTRKGIFEAIDKRVADLKAGAR
ncbi:MAG: hypothetical protein AAGD25_06950 [Cyanobacteria bacterium P01_F01_bin.150]